jgi:hypothetical protein
LLEISNDVGTARGIELRFERIAADALPSSAYTFVVMTIAVLAVIGGLSVKFKSRSRQ